MMAIADMFLKLQGITGEATDAAYQSEIDVVSWSWGMQAPTSVTTGQALGRSTIGELQVVKRVDRATPTLMQFLHGNVLIGQGKLTVRKAGASPFVYFTIALDEVRITAITDESRDSELMERVSLAFRKVTVEYTPQGPSGGAGGGAVIFAADAHRG